MFQDKERTPLKSLAGSRQGDSLYNGKMSGVEYDAQEVERMFKEQALQFCKENVSKYGENLRSLVEGAIFGSQSSHGSKNGVNDALYAMEVVEALTTLLKNCGEEVYAAVCANFHFSTFLSELNLSKSSMDNDINELEKNESFMDKPDKQDYMDEAQMMTNEREQELTVVYEKRWSDKNDGFRKPTKKGKASSSENADESTDEFVAFVQSTEFQQLKYEVDKVHKENFNIKMREIYCLLQLRLHKLQPL